MSLAIDMARRRAAGFGSWSDFELPPIETGGWDPNAGSGGGSGSDESGGHDMPWWVSGAPVFGVIGKTLSNIFGNQYQQPNTAYRPAPTYQPGYPAGYRQPNAGVGIGIDGNGIRLSDGSHIGWFPIIGVIGFFYVLQARPLSRK